MLLEAERLSSGHRRAWVRPLPGSGCAFSLRPLAVKGRGTAGSSVRGEHRFYREGFTAMTWSPPKGPLPQLIALGLEFLHMDLGGRTPSAQCRDPSRRHAVILREMDDPTGTSVRR